MKYKSIKAIIDTANERKVKISDFIIEEQIEATGEKKEALINKMKEAYDVMKKSIEIGFTERCKLKIEQEDGAKIYKKYLDSGKSMFGEKVGLAVAMAMSVSEVNASMGKIVAAPTAGSCGILPAALVATEKNYNIEEDKIINAMFTASAIGMVVANVFSIAGATGGCQAECGTAGAMAAAAVVEILGGTPNQIGDAIAICIKNIEGLVCDPVAGLVECPCIKRNASGVVNALLAADMALSGVKSIIPVDEVILAMKQSGEVMDDRLKETAGGGLATTETGLRLKHKIFG